MKALSTLAIATCLTVSLSFSRPAQASVIGVAFSPVVLVGVLGPSAVGAANKYIIKSKGIDRILTKFSTPLLAWTFGSFMGLMILDGEETQSYSYNQMSEEEALKLGLTSVELESYNSEVDQLNYLVAEVSGELARAENPTIDQSVKIWDELKPSLSPNTLSAVTKMWKQ